MLRLFQTTTTVGEESGDLIEQGKELIDGVLENLPENLPENVSSAIDQAKAEPLLLAILIGIGVLTAIIFFWGITKQLFKAAIIAGILSFGAWYWYFNIR